MATQLNALKTINNLQRDGSLQHLLLSIKQSKVAIDSFAKGVQDQKSKLQAKARDEEKKKVELEKAKAAAKKVLKGEPEQVSESDTGQQGGHPEE